MSSRSWKNWGLHFILWYRYLKISLGSMFLAFLWLFWPKINNFLKIRWSRIWKNPSWPDGKRVGLLAEVSLWPDLEDCILSLVIDECPRENWGFLVPASIQNSSWHRWRWDRKYQFFASHHYYQYFKKKVEQNRMTLSIFMSKNVFSLCLIGLSLDGALGLQVCPKKFFSSAMYSPLVALSYPILKKMSQKISRKSLLRASFAHACCILNIYTIFLILPTDV